MHALDRSRFEVFEKVASTCCANVFEPQEREDTVIQDVENYNRKYLLELRDQLGLNEKKTVNAQVGKEEKQKDGDGLSLLTTEKQQFVWRRRKG